LRDVLPLLALVALCAGCLPAQPATRATLDAPATLTVHAPTARATFTPVIAREPPAGVKATAVYETAVATGVTDGDTVTVEMGGRSYRLRYIGIDAPETGFEQEALGAEATEENRRLVLGKPVRLERDVSDTDRFGRLLRYVWVDDIMVNAELVRLGYARVRRYPPDVRRHEALEAAQEEAQGARRGIWGLQVAVTPPGAPATPPRPAATPGQAGYSCARCIKGNISPSGEKIYHIPGCRDYDATVVSEGRGERWFSTEVEAQQAGWRRARNCP